VGCGRPLLLPVTEKVPEPPPASSARGWTWSLTKTMAISPTGERMRIVLNLPALKRIMSISFRKARAHGSGVRRLRGEGARGLDAF
jgi:hypothetical protein